MLEIKDIAAMLYHSSHHINAKGNNIRCSKAIHEICHLLWVKTSIGTHNEKWWV
jgi:hypothetical protein